MMMRIFSLFFTCLTLCAPYYTSGQVVKATIPKERSNHLEVELDREVSIDNSEGWYLEGGCAEIKRLLSRKTSTILTFELTDHALPDDSFRLNYYEGFGNTRSGTRSFPPVRGVEVQNDAAEYSGERRIFYISARSSPRNSGTTPKDPASFSQIIGRVEAGDYVLFNRGESYDNQVLLENKKGTPAKPIIVGYYGRGSAPRLTHQDNVPLSIVQCEWVQAVGFHIAPALGKSGAQQINGSRYCKLRSLHIEGKETSESQGDPDRMYGEGAGIIYSRFGGDESKRSFRCEVLHCVTATFRRGIYGESPNECFVAFNRVKNLSEDGIRVIQGDASFTRVSYNEITDWSDDGIDTYTGSNVILEYNIIHDPMLPLPNGANNGIKGGGVFKVNLGQPTSYNNVYRYNTIFNIPIRLNFSPAGITTNGCLSGEIYGNLCYNIDHNAIEITKSDRPSDRWQVYHNTAISNRFNGLFIAPGNPNVIVVNNIFKGGKEDIAMAGDVFAEQRNNILAGAATSASYRGVNDLKADFEKVFAVTTGPGFDLDRNSGVIDYGVEVRTYIRDMLGNPILNEPDPGCLESAGD